LPTQRRTGLAGYTAARRESYPHRSGVQLESVFMEKVFTC